MSEKRIYFLRPVGQVGPIKIGCSVDAENRLATYIPWSPIKLEIVVTAAGSHMEERRLHGMFGKDWLHHEWFGASKELLALIDYVVATGALPELPRVIKFRAKPQSRPRVKSVDGYGQRTMELARAILPLYEDGDDIQALAAQFHRPISGIVRALKAVGVKRVRGTGALRKEGVIDIARAEAFAARYRGGATLEAIGKEYGLTRERVRQVLRAFGVEKLGWRPRGVRPVSDLDREIAERYEGGETVAALKIEYPDAPVEGAILRCGLRGKKMKEASARYDARAALVASAYVAGASFTEICAEFGFAHRENIYRHLRRAGVKPNRLAA